MRSLQTWLNLADNADLSVDGRFGTATRDAVIHFQRRFGLPPVGEFGPASKAALRTWYRQMTKAQAPRAEDGTTVRTPLRCQDPATTDACNRGLPGGIVHTDMGSRLLKSLACAGAGIVAGRISLIFGAAVGVVCDLVLGELFP